MTEIEKRAITNKFIASYGQKTYKMEHLIHLMIDVFEECEKMRKQNDDT